MQFSGEHYLLSKSEWQHPAYFLFDCNGSIRGLENLELFYWKLKDGLILFLNATQRVIFIFRNDGIRWLAKDKNNSGWLILTSIRKSFFGHNYINSNLSKLCLEMRYEETCAKIETIEIPAISEKIDYILSCKEQLNLPKFRRQKARAFLDDLLMLPEITEDAWDFLSSMMYQFIESIDATTITLPPPLRYLEEERFVATNPSCAVAKWGYIFNYRLVNYLCTRATKYVFKDKDFIIRSRNIIELRNIYGEMISQHPLILLDDNHYDLIFHHVRFQGLEDIRLITVDGELHFSASFAQLNPHAISRMVYGKTTLRTDEINSPTLIDGTPIFVNQLIELKSTNNNRVEKNWMPISSPIRWIYSISPWQMFTIETNTHNYSKPENTHNKTQVGLTNLCGGAGPIDFGNGKWFSIVHYHGRKEGRYYYHRFVQHDSQTMTPFAISQTFCFNQDPDKMEVEFACGIMQGHDGNIWITSGRDDRQAILSKINPQVIDLLTWYPINKE